LLQLRVRLVDAQAFLGLACSSEILDMMKVGKARSFLCQQMINAGHRALLCFHASSRQLARLDDRFAGMAQKIMM